MENQIIFDSLQTINNKLDVLQTDVVILKSQMSYFMWGFRLFFGAIILGIAGVIVASFKTGWDGFRNWLVRVRNTPIRKRASSAR